MPRSRDAAETPQPDIPAVTADAPSRWTRAVAWVLLTGAVIVPLYVSRDGDDHFRLPKELLVHAIAIIALAVAAIGVTLRRITLSRELLQRLRIPLAIAGAGLLWMVLTTLTSTNRPVSVEALIWAASLLVVFALATYFLRFVPMMMVVGALLLPAIINATLLLLQAGNIYNPWVFPADTYTRAKKIAFLGNPDDIGVYLAALALFAFALTLTTRRRFLFGGIGLVIAAALLATETLTALGAFVVATPLLLVVWKPRFAKLLPIFVVLFGVALVFGPTRDRVTNITAAIRNGNWGPVVSGRLVPFAAAWRMFQERPLVGLGPGCYKYHYMREYIAIRTDSPKFFAMARTLPVNFGETHNDHLQALAETGFPGYALALAAMLALAARSLAGRREMREAPSLARTLAAPFAALTFIIMLAQFPFQLAATGYSFVMIAAACFAWSTPDEEPAVQEEAGA